jgi:hypothetical protein
MILLSVNSVQSAERPSSTERLAADPRSAYFSIKSILAKDIRTKWIPADQVCASNVEAKEIRVLCCTGVSTFYVMGPLRRLLLEIAFNVLRTQSAMLANHIPALYWQEPLLHYEEDALLAIKEKQYTQANKGSIEFTFMVLDVDSFPALIKTIANSVQRAGLDFNIHLGECGGPANTITIKTSPPGGIVYLLPRIFYLLCKKQGDDVDDVKQCDHWLPPLHTPEESPVGGVYRYRIEWPDKRTSVSEFDSDRYDTEVTLQ